MRPAWVTRQIANLVAQFCAGSGNAAWIGVSDREMLATVDRGSVRVAPFRLGGGYRLLPGLAIEDGFVWVPEATGGEPELWLSPTKTGYREIFENFAKRFLGAPGLAGAEVQIDHVFPKKAGALNGLAYVRMLAIPPESNMAAGRTVERAMAGRAAAAPRGKLVRLATYYTIGKATGFAGYDRLPDGEDANANRPAVTALFAHLRGFGLPPDVLTALDARLTADTLTRHR